MGEDCHKKVVGKGDCQGTLGLVHVLSSHWKRRDSNENN